MRVIQPLILAALVSPSSADKTEYLPPSTGKFFYSDFKYADQYKNGYAMETSVGSSRTKMNLKLSTWHQGSYIYTDACTFPSPCNIPGLYNLGSSKSKTMIQGSEGTTEDIHWLDTDQHLTLTGTNYKDEYLMKFEKYGRMITFQNQFLAVDNVSEDIEFDNHNGLIGLAPYSADLDNMETNFLWQMKDQGIIDHMVTSIYVDEDESFVKFGSYDKLGIQDGTFEVFKTSGVLDWSVYMEKPQIGGKFAKDTTNFLDVNPAYPFLYISTTNTQSIRQMIVDAGQKQRISIACVGDAIYCYTAHPCSDITEQQRTAFEVKLTVTGLYKSNYKITVPGQEFFIESEELGLDKGNCYIGIFTEKQESGRNVWTMGTKFMKHYYFVFDQTPFNERAENHNYIGIGAKNPENLIGKQHYDPSSPSYDPEDESLDQSIDMDDFDDPYKSFAFWLRDNKGLFIFLICLFVFLSCCVAYIVKVQCKKKKSYTFRLYSENLNKSGIQ